MVKVALGFVVGVYLLQQSASLPSTWFIILLLLSAAGLCVFLAKSPFSQKVLPSTLSAMLIAGLIGYAWSGILATQRMDDALPKAWEGKRIQITGVVASLPKTNDSSERFVFDVEQVLTQNAHVPKRIMLSFYPYRFNSTVRIAPEDLSFKVGQRWQLTVRLKRPHGSYNPHGFDYEAWVLGQSIRASGYIDLKSPVTLRKLFVWKPIYMVHHGRTLVGERVSQALQGAAYGGVIRALVVGEKSQISQAQWQTFLNSGTNHLMSISGLHISMLAGFAYAIVNMVWRRLPKLMYRMPAQKAATLAGVIVAILYAALAGFSVPTQRALYMLLTVAAMLLLNRRISFSSILATALLVVLIIDPWAVLGAGFWLSFGAVAAIAYASAGRLAHGHWLIVACKTQWAVTLALIPALVLLFGQFSFISPIANALAIPLMSLVVIPFAIVGSILNWTACIQFAHASLEYCMHALTWLTNLPLVTWQQALPPWWAVCIAIFGVVWHLLPRGMPFRYLALLCFSPMLLAKPTPLPKGAFVATVLDVGQGLSVLVQTKTHALLYDAGARYSQARDAGTNMILPFMRGEGITKLDVAIASHDDLDHVGGFVSVLQQVPADLLVSSLSKEADLIRTVEQLPRQPQQQACKAGQHWVWDGVHFEILAPNSQDLINAQLNDNDKSCVLRVSHGHQALLIAGDIEKHTEYWLVANMVEKLASDVLVAPHHGSQTSSTADFVAAVQPKTVIIANGYLNRFGHPKPAVVQRYQDIGATVYRSDQHGAVQVKLGTQGTQTVTSWRERAQRYWHQNN